MLRMMSEVSLEGKVGGVIEGAEDYLLPLFERFMAWIVRLWRSSARWR